MADSLSSRLLAGSSLCSARVWQVPGYIIGQAVPFSRRVATLQERVLDVVVNEYIHTHIPGGLQIQYDGWFDPYTHLMENEVNEYYFHLMPLQ